MFSDSNTWTARFPLPLLAAHLQPIHANKAASSLPKHLADCSETSPINQLQPQLAKYLQRYQSHLRKGCLDVSNSADRKSASLPASHPARLSVNQEDASTPTAIRHITFLTSNYSLYDLYPILRDSYPTDPSFTHP